MSAAMPNLDQGVRFDGRFDGRVRWKGSMEGVDGRVRWEGSMGRFEPFGRRYKVGLDESAVLVAQRKLEHRIDLAALGS